MAATVDRNAPCSASAASSTRSKARPNWRAALSRIDRSAAATLSGACSAVTIPEGCGPNRPICKPSNAFALLAAGISIANEPTPAIQRRASGCAARSGGRSAASRLSTALRIARLLVEATTITGGAASGPASAASTTRVATSDRISVVLPVPGGPATAMISPSASAPT